MASKFSLIFALFAVICLSVVSFASPIKDISTTTLGVSETSTPTSEHVAVAVQRVDDLIDDNGKWLAERVEAVIINFDLKNDQVLVNNVPVEIGVSSVQVVEAQIVPANIKIEQLEEYADNFDIGLVTVQVSSIIESVQISDDDSLRRVKITIRVMEIDGVNVVQYQNVIEKVIEFKGLDLVDGDKDIHAPLYPSEELKKHDDHKSTPLSSRVHRWWRCSSRFTRIVLASLFLTALFGIVFIAVPAIVQSLVELVRPPSSSSSRYSAVTLDESVFEQVIYITDEEKRALMEQEKELNNNQ